MRIIIALYFLLIVVGVTGWIKNIIHLSECDFKESYKAEILYGIGCVTPLGAVFGYIDLGK